MDAVEQIRAEIPDFPGCESENECRLSDEQIRAYAGERLARVDREKLPAELRDVYEKLIFRCEFMNQEAFRVFAEDRSGSRVAAVLDADAAMVAAAKQIDSNADGLGEKFKALADAFDRRDAAMKKSG